MYLDCCDGTCWFIVLNHILYAHIFRYVVILHINNISYSYLNEQTLKRKTKKNVCMPDRLVQHCFAVVRIYAQPKCKQLNCFTKHCCAYMRVYKYCTVKWKHIHSIWMWICICIHLNKVTDFLIKNNKLLIKLLFV